MSTQTLDELLVSDIDDLTLLAATVRSDARNALLYSVAEALQNPAVPSRLKLIGFLQALAASAHSLDDSVTESVAMPLIKAAHADDPAERLAALRSLAVVASHVHANLAFTHSILATFERLRLDSSLDVSSLATELSSADNPVYRRLAAVASV
jgi:hypothetical protein